MLFFVEDGSTWANNLMKGASLGDLQQVTPNTFQDHNFLEKAFWKVCLQGVKGN